MSKKITINQHNGHEFVEIAGIKWATCNVGAEKPTDAGLYFQWGDRKGYTFDEVGKIKMFDLNHYKHYNGRRLTKYTKFDRKDVLDLCDDAAFAYMGQGWRMPTYEDFRSLIANTRTTWTYSYQNSGVAGTVFTDITDATKELFFPALGFCKNGYVHSIGTCGYYWSDSLELGDSHYSGYFCLYRGCGDWQGDTGREFGFAVRGVLAD